MKRSRAIRDPVMPTIKGWQWMNRVRAMSPILWGLAMGLIAGVIYIAQRQPTYEVSVSVTPPLLGSLAELNYGRGVEGGLPIVTESEVFAMFRNTLQSESLKREAFINLRRAAVDAEGDGPFAEERYTDYKRAISIIERVGAGENKLLVAVRARSPEAARRQLEDYLALARVKAMKDVMFNAQKEAQVRRVALQHEARLYSEMGNRLKSDEIVRLREAAAIAQSIKAEKPIAMNVISQRQDGMMANEVLYARGEEALKAEIDSLNRRHDNGPYMLGLRKLQLAAESVAVLENVKKNFDVFRVDGDKVGVATPVHMRAVWVIPIFAFMGLILGMLCVGGQSIMALAHRSLHSAQARCPSP